MENWSCWYGRNRKISVVVVIVFVVGRGVVVVVVVVAAVVVDVVVDVVIDFVVIVVVITFRPIPCIIVPQQTVTGSRLRVHWDFYQRTINDKWTHIFCDLGTADILMGEE